MLLLGTTCRTTSGNNCSHSFSDVCRPSSFNPSAFLGFVACVAMMFVVNPLFSAVAIGKSERMPYAFVIPHSYHGNRMYCIHSMSLNSNCLDLFLSLPRPCSTPPPPVVMLILFMGLFMFGPATEWGDVSQALIFYQVRAGTQCLYSKCPWALIQYVTQHLSMYVKFQRAHFTLPVSTPSTVGSVN